MFCTNKFKWIHHLCAETSSMCTVALPKRYSRYNEVQISRSSTIRSCVSFLQAFLCCFMCSYNTRTQTRRTKRLMFLINYTFIPFHSLSSPFAFMHYISRAMSSHSEFFFLIRFVIQIPKFQYPF